MTQRNLAAAIGVNADHIAYIENSRRRPSIDAQEGHLRRKRETTLEGCFRPN
jgi:hypothetical protein